MLKKAAIVCEIIKEDIKEIIANVDYQLDVHYLESKLHNEPAKLKENVQSVIDELKDYDEVILTYGLCGNGMAGITATNCDIRYPKVDDCICAMMCYSNEYLDLRKDSYFTSRGWLSVGRTFSEELKYIYSKYNKKTADMILKSLYGNYKRLVYMQTEETIEKENSQKALQMSDAIDIELVYKKASLKIYEDLLNGNVNSRIGVLHKGESLKAMDFLG